MVELDPPPPITPLPEAQVWRLLPRVAGALGLTWPIGRAGVTGAGGFMANLADRPGEESLVWATLNGEDGLMGLFAGDRLLGTADGSMAQIIRVQAVPLPGLAILALIVDDLDDQLVGAFFREERRRIYVWDGRRLRQLFAGELRTERFAHAQWQNPRAPSLWRLHLTLGDVALQGGSLRYTDRRQELEAAGSPRAPIPPASAFRLISERRGEHTYRWNPRLRRFDPVSG